MDGKQVRNTALLVLGALIWGTAFAAQSRGQRLRGSLHTFWPAAAGWPAHSCWCCCMCGGAWQRGAHVRPAGQTPAPSGGTAKRWSWAGRLCGDLSVCRVGRPADGACGTATTAKAGVHDCPVCGARAGLRHLSRPPPRPPSIWVCVAVSVAGLYLLCHGRARDTLSLTGGEGSDCCSARLLFALQILLVGTISAPTGWTAIHAQLCTSS